MDFIGGELAQLVERCDRTAEVRGSNPLFSMAKQLYLNDFLKAHQKIKCSNYTSVKGLRTLSHLFDFSLIIDL